MLPKLDAIPAIVNMMDRQCAAAQPMPPAWPISIRSEENTKILGTEGPANMSVNTKRVFYVKYLAHQVYADILRDATRRSIGPA